ncbi:hypothetical protein L5515_012990 [Caenorhabditis briggsae]|uniref:Uncharacterized protein n=1 Tax=Caenorhabditis briggsae TaxID=6238 RepID=A0AAE9DFX4_CAEBR|nr:hypothetical protein L3Y34_016833 [Caenorhabditis briggsae]UMM15621.1 hypothetical protein L5515_012990 [Caenorhabditis briggsae]
MQSKSPVVDAKEQMKKKTPEELAQMAIVNRAFSAESSDDPPPLLQKRSESTLEPLNNQLKSVPLVKAFNSAENQLDKQAQKK